MQKFMQKPFPLLGSLLMLLALSYSMASNSQTRSPDLHLTMGNPSGATTSTANSSNYLIKRPTYSLSYNKDKKIGNWASWQLNQSWLGNEDRCEPFLPDNPYPLTGTEPCLQSTPVADLIGDTSFLPEIELRMPQKIVPPF